MINVRTKRPVLEENSAEVQLQYGSFDTRKANVALNFAAGDKVAFRFAGMYLNSDGYYKNNAPYGPIGETVAPFNTAKWLGDSGVGDGSDIGGDDVFSGRAKLMWSPNDDVNILLQYEIVRDRGDSPPIVQESTAGYVVPLWSFPSAPPNEDPLKNAGSTLRDDGKFLDIPGGHRIDIDGFYLNGDWAINNNYTLYFNAALVSRNLCCRVPTSATPARYRWVTRAPPSLSESQPPTGRSKAPTPAPMKMKLALLSPVEAPAFAPTRTTPKTSSMSLGNALA